MEDRDSRETGSKWDEPYDYPRLLAWKSFQAATQWGGAQEDTTGL